MNKIAALLKRTAVAGLCAALLCGLGFTTGCSESEESVSVQSVAEICGLGTIVDVYAGVVSARSEVTIKQSTDKTVGEIKVAEGDTVSEGQVLFTYDTEKMQIDYDKAALELEQLKANIAAKQKEIETLNKEKKSASESDKLRYTLEIQSCETDLREQNYNLGLKEKDVEKLAAALEETEYKSPINGRVKALNPDGGYDSNGNEKPFMELVESGAYRVKGYVNENNAASLSAAGSVIVRSRVDETQVWKGAISSVDWENPQTGGSSYYYVDSSSDTSSSSKYPFYVELESSEGLMLGQHVYIEPDLGQMDETSGINLPAFYLFDISEDSAYVWAEDASGRIEKRELAIADYDADTDCYIVTEGLVEKDYIAFPDETVSAGMSCAHNADAYTDDIDSDITVDGYDKVYGDEITAGDVVYDAAETTAGAEITGGAIG